jgi:hypothetical protein
MINHRGTGPSREHTWLSANTDPEYWTFGFVEFGEYDLKATIDFIQ